MITLDLGNIVPIYRGAYDSSLTYAPLSYVKHNGEIWYGKEGSLPHEEPSISGKWVLFMPQNSTVYANNSVLFTDNTGAVSELPLADGRLTYDTINGLHFAPEQLINNKPSIKYLADNFSTTYGAVFIGTDDKIYRAGYKGSDVACFTSSQFNQDTFKEVPMIGIKTGTWAKVYVAYSQIWAITTTGELWFIGYNKDAVGFLPANNTFARVLTKSTITNVKQLAISGSINGTDISALVITEDGSGTSRAFSGGANTYGICGIGDASILSAHQEIDVTGMTHPLIGAYGGATHKYGMFTILDSSLTDNMYVAGYGGYGQLGMGDATTLHSFTKVTSTNGEKIVKVAVGGTTSSQVTCLVLTASSKIGAVGYGGYGVGGWGDNVNKNTLQWWDQSGFIDLVICDSYAGASLGLTSTGRVFKTGYTNYYLNGDGTNTQHFSPVDLNLDTGTGKVTKIQLSSSHNQHSLWVMTDAGEMFHTGTRATNQQGNGNSVANMINKVVIDNVTDFAGCGVGANQFVLAITSDSKGKSWGYNGHGNCGQSIVGSTIVEPSPISII